MYQLFKKHVPPFKANMNIFFVFVLVSKFENLADRYFVFFFFFLICKKKKKKKRWGGGGGEFLQNTHIQKVKGVQPPTSPPPPTPSAYAPGQCTIVNVLACTPREGKMIEKDSGEDVEKEKQGNT